MIKLWNELPENVVSAASVSTFKGKLETFWSSEEILQVFEHHQILYRLCHLSTKYSVGSKMGIETCRYQKFVVLALALVKMFDFLKFHEVLIY